MIVYVRVSCWMDSIDFKNSEENFDFISFFVIFLFFNNVNLQ